MAMSPEERKARDAERKRKARAEAAEKRDAQRADARTSSASAAPTTMRDEVDAAVAAMSKWLTASDGALIAQARSLAKMVDELTHAGEVTKSLSAHGRLTRVLNDLGGTPTVRMQHELRSLKIARKSEADGERESGEGDTAGAGGNVTQFPRPARRSS